MDARIKRIIVDRALEKHEKLAAILRYLFVELAGVSQTKYYILGSYAIREHRTISDLDINMDHDEFFKLGALTDRGMGAVQIYGGAQIRGRLPRRQLLAAGPEGGARPRRGPAVRPSVLQPPDAAALEDRHEPREGPP